MYAALTPNLYLGEPPFSAVFCSYPTQAAMFVAEGTTVWVIDIDTARLALYLLGLTDAEVSNATTAAKRGLAAVYTPVMPVTR